MGYAPPYPNSPQEFGAWLLSHKRLRPRVLEPSAAQTKDNPKPIRQIRDNKNMKLAGKAAKCSMQVENFNPYCPVIGDITGKSLDYELVVAFDSGKYGNPSIRLTIFVATV